METYFFDPSASLPINTLAITKHLRANGYTETQAEAQAELWVKIIDSSLAKKNDIDELKRQIAEIGARTERDIAALSAKTEITMANLRSDMEKMEYRMTIKLGGMLVVAITAMAAMIKLL